MKKVSEHAGQCGVKLGIEFLNRFETYFINRGDQALALAEATGPNCGVCLDIFHMNLEENDYYEVIDWDTGLPLDPIQPGDADRPPTLEGWNTSSRWTQPLTARFGVRLSF